ncbi:MAG: sulfatase-like hydrolase/transferase [Clostridia bacterium]|nr:sulfatase-like hydrolase/transferase [Clostridia bacterium]
MEYIVFENGVYPKKLERQFFRYCLVRQLSLLKFIFIYLLIDAARYFHLISRVKYMRKHWSFLPSVRDLHTKIDDFAAKYSKLARLPEDDVVILSEHPRIIVKKLVGRKVTANKYQIKKHTFKAFNSVESMIDEEEYTAYGDYRSPILKKAAVKKYISGRKVYEGTRSYVLHIVLRYTITAVILLGLSAALGALSRYYASLSHENHAALFASYFANARIFWLNTIPIIAILAFLYFIFNRLSYAFLIGGLGIYALSLTNYFKIQFRSDPIWFDDINIISEANNMTDRYIVKLSTEMIVFFIAIPVIAAIIRIFLNDRIRRNYIRPLGAAAVFFAFAILLTNVYLSERLYVNTKNPGFEKDFSTRDQYIARGFIYPLLYSVKGAEEKPPVLYKAPEIKNQLEQYTPEDIPDENKVNIIGIMLEAYGDFSRFPEIEFTVDPYENIKEFRENSYTGELVTDIFAAGTVTTERQFLTGLPYDLNLVRKNMNSYVWYLRDQGYTVNGGHPSHSWFYERKNANIFLGFQNYNFDDDYYFNKYEYHIADNYCLFEDVIDNFEDAVSKGEKTFSFYVTYEGHGPYDDTIKYYEEEFPNGFLKDKGYDDASLAIANNYFYLVNNTNKWLAKLSRELNESEEPVVLVLFGDHMPWMGNNNCVYNDLGIDLDLSTEKGFYNYYETPYMVWANDAARVKFGDVFNGYGGRFGPYFLMNHVFSLLGWKGNEYMQYMNEIEKTFTAIHSTGYTICNGELTKDLDDKNKDLINDLSKVKFYWKNTFKYSGDLSSNKQPVE